MADVAFPVRQLKSQAFSELFVQIKVLSHQDSIVESQAFFFNTIIVSGQTSMVETIT